MKPPAKRSQARLARARAPRATARAPQRPEVSGAPGARADFNARSGTKRAVDPRNKLNALTGEQWLYRSKSVLQTAYPSAYGHKLRKRHGANKPPQLMRDLIEFFSKPGECVLDPFAGVGGTLIGAALCGRRAVGIEINPEWARVYAQVCAEQGIAPQEMIVGDCLAAIDALPEGSADLVATDPPYNLQFERTMCTGVYDRQNRKTDYESFSDHPDDFSNSGTYLEFLDRIERMFAGVLRALRAGGYVVVILRNAYQDGEYIMTQADVAARARRPVRREGKLDFRLYLKGEIIWHQSGSRLRPYGYPYAFVPNIAHQTILVLRKEPIRSSERAAPEASRAVGARADFNASSGTKRPKEPRP